MALLAAKGGLAPRTKFIHESIIGTKFEGFYEPCEKVGDFEAICPYITATANITGFNWLIRQENDPMFPGFLLG